MGSHLIIINIFCDDECELKPEFNLIGYSKQNPNDINLQTINF